MQVFFVAKVIRIFIIYLYRQHLDYPCVFKYLYRSVISNDPIMVDKMVPSAHRFDVVADLLEMTMSDIAHELSR
jgi:hypothetical protein